MRNVQTEFVEKMKTHLMLNNIFQISWHLWDNVEKVCATGQPWMTMWHMHIACWIQKSTNALSQYVVLTAFQLQQWLHECASKLRYRTVPVWLYIPRCPKFSQKSVAQHHSLTTINAK